MELNNDLFVEIVLRTLLALFIIKVYLMLEYKFNFSRKTANRLINVFIVDTILFIAVLAYVFYYY